MPSFALIGNPPGSQEISRVNAADGHAAAQLFETALADAAIEGIAFEKIAKRSVESPFVVTQIDGDAAGRAGTLIGGRWCVGRSSQILHDGEFVVMASEEGGPAVPIGRFATPGIADFLSRAWCAGMVPPLADEEVQALLAARVDAPGTASKAA